MTEIAAWGVTVAAAIGGMLAGALLCVAWVRRAARMRKRIPLRWPLNARALANTEERKVWRWLSEAFSDHHIMLKTPVTRFTLPRSKNKEHGMHWYQLLSGVYCTLTVCAADGRVVGCVDVPGSKPVSRRNRKLKQTLLPQCGMAYWVIDSSKLPTRAEIRSAFLGDEGAPKQSHELDETIITAARMKLRASLDNQRQGRPSDMAALSFLNEGLFDEGADSDLGSDSNFGSGLHQGNSFIAPLDSRGADLS
jgi:Protein of unknown function (DUF2726)